MRYETIHEVNDPEKVARIAASMQSEGWVGAPVVIFGEMLQVTGVHRAAAAEIAGIEMETIELEEVFAEDGADWNAALEDYNALSYWSAGVAEMVKHLSEATREKYGIDVH